ncbi:GPO family capsid scaffolding protein [Shewanella sp. MBTL60-007]|uniref:GPO family capsid scaffolding protein n=1 Tax=Shewanella sp. MBTL60-007 TaxID=2815911 RepID=UPI001BC2CCCB|nr:GPO family capsid scaffolding protein [Shewanella sp. MBTL60-007]GIU12971.1 phage capsid scaffolding protein [Shewanella sp. MBTL60-007]
MGKQTGWVIAATEGATVDGRTITKEWIKDMAEQYSIDEYTAMIWPEHFRSTWGPFEGKNWGTVDEVKAATAGGKLRLYVKLTANDYLLEANKDGQKLFMSIEPNIDYKGTGKAYLQGIAVTDSPASTGTTRLKFSIGEVDTEREYSQLEPLELTDFIQDTESKSVQSRLFGVLEAFFRSNTPASANDIEEEQPMTKEQHEAVMAQFSAIGDRLQSLEEKTAAFSVKPTETEEERPPAGEQQNGITAEQFGTLNETLTNLTAKVDGMETQFKELSKETGDQEPDPAGTGDNFTCV